MTYCLGMLLNDGLVMASDSRTNAGVDSVSTFRKMHVFTKPGDRVIVLVSAGNLAVTQSVLTMLDEGLGPEAPELSLHTVESLYEAARLVGRALRKVHDVDGPYLKAQDAGFSASFILGGQIKGQRMRLFQIYSAGNFIEATPETPYFQIGETKYGKPIIERVLTPELDLVSAAKCALVSLDSTIRSNISVAPPVDLLLYQRDYLKIATWQRLGDDDPYFMAVRRHWGEGLRNLFDEVPSPDWQQDIQPNK